MALFFARRIERGETEFERVPGALREQVARILREEGYERLITESGTWTE